MLKLYGSTGSPFVRKVRIVLAEKKLEYDFILEDVWADQSHILTLNPLGKVPCIVMDDQSSIFDSRVIVEYLDTLSPVANLIPSQGRQRTEVKRWEALADGLCDAAIAIRLEFLQRAEQQRVSAVIERQQQKIQAILALMSQELKESPYCMGNSISLADIAVGCSLDYLCFRMPELTWQTKYPNLQKLLEKLSTRPSFATTQPH